MWCMLQRTKHCSALWPLSVEILGSWAEIEMKLAIQSSSRVTTNDECSGWARSIEVDNSLSWGCTKWMWFFLELLKTLSMQQHEMVSLVATRFTHPDWYNGMPISAEQVSRKAGFASNSRYSCASLAIAVLYFPSIFCGFGYAFRFLRVLKGA